MGRQDEYREKAREAERAAKLMSRNDERDAMLGIARTWHEMADAEAKRVAERGSE